MLYLLYILDSQFVISVRIWLEGLIFTYKRGRLSATSYRSDAAGRCCRGRKRGEKIKTGRIIGIACGISVYCACHQVLKSVFQRSEKREWERERGDRGWRETIGTHRRDWRTWRHEGIILSYHPPILYQRQERLLLWYLVLSL